MGRLEDLKQAISAFKTAIEATPDPDGLSCDLMESYYHLGLALISLCRCTGRPETATEAVQLLQKTLEISVALSHPPLPHHYGGLGSAFFGA